MDDRDRSAKIAKRAREIERLCLKFEIPILCDTAQGIAHLGTGTLLELANRHFVITARHIFKDDKTNVDRQDLSQLAFPENPFKSDISTFGTFDKFEDEKNTVTDVAILELKDETTVRKLQAGWRFVGADRIAIPSKDGYFFIMGYPLVNLSNKGGWIAAKPTTIYSQRLLTIPEDATKPVNTQVDMFFEYSREAEKTGTKEVVQTPELEGMSGASVWEYFPNERILTVEPQIGIVGVQSAYLHSEYFRAINWWVVAAILEQRDRVLGAHFRKILGGK